VACVVQSVRWNELLHQRWWYITFINLSCALLSLPANAGILLAGRSHARRMACSNPSIHQLLFDCGFRWNEPPNIIVSWFSTLQESHVGNAPSLSSNRHNKLQGLGYHSFFNLSIPQFAQFYASFVTEKQTGRASYKLARPVPNADAFAYLIDQSASLCIAQNSAYCHQIGVDPSSLTSGPVHCPGRRSAFYGRGWLEFWCLCHR